MTLSEVTLLVLSLFINFIIFKYFDIIRKFIPIYDIPNLSRKTHKLPVSVLGGIWILINFLIIILYLSLFNDNLLIKSHFINLRDKFHLLVFLTIFLTLGLYDDANDIKYKQKSFIFFILSFFLFYTNEKLIIYSIQIIFIDKKYNFFLGKYSLLFITFSFIFLLVSLNFLDGINLNLGLFYSINILFLFFLTKNVIFLYLLIPIIFILYLNYNSRVFLGDSGSYIISIILMFFFINNYNQGLITFDKIFILLLYPTVDFVRVITIRLFTFKNPAIGDRNHFHHILENKFGNLWAILIISLKNLFLIISSLFMPPLYIVAFYILVYFGILFICKSKISTI
jgi:UDP-GlcNAc:undecaprenyl-phosphate GlcNAc-1-phosphate transferase